MIMRSPNFRRPSGWAILCSLLAILALTGSAVADTIYLKNGRTIHTERARVEGDWVVFEQFGSEVRIPVSIVDRVEQDERGGPEPTPTSPPEAMPEPGEEEAEAGDAEADEGEAETDEGQAEADGEDGEAEEEPAPEETRAYWQDRVRAILEERAELEERLQELRREERAFLFSHRSTAETRRQIEDVQERQRELDAEMEELRREARRQGVPPGWLRVRVDPSARSDDG